MTASSPYKLFHNIGMPLKYLYRDGGMRCIRAIRPHLKNFATTLGKAE
jgi:hypothetical protein